MDQCSLEELQSTVVNWKYSWCVPVLSVTRIDILTPKYQKPTGNDCTQLKNDSDQLENKSILEKNYC